MGVERIKERLGFGAGGLKTLRSEGPLFELSFLGGSVFDVGKSSHGSEESRVCLGEGTSDEARGIQFDG